MTLNDLARMFELPPRQVRYLIAEGVIPPAKNLGSGADGFDAVHLAAGRAFRALAAKGLGVRKAKVLRGNRRMSSFPSRPAASLRLGSTLTRLPGCCGGVAPVRPIHHDPPDIRSRASCI